MLTYKKLHELLDYDSETGIFVWKKIKGNRNKKEAGTVKKEGYRQISINKTKYYAHRLAWMYVHGYLPENCIDHINRKKDDNRIVNLREASYQCNLRNSNLSEANTSGITGVSWDEAKQKWHVYARVNYKLHHFGRYRDFDEAVCHRLAAEQCLNWPGCNKSSAAYLYVKNNIQKGE